MISISFKRKVLFAALLLLSLSTIDRSFAAQPTEENQKKHKIIKRSNALFPGPRREQDDDVPDELRIGIDVNPPSNNALLSTVDNDLNCPTSKKNKLRILIGIGIGAGVSITLIGMSFNELFPMIIGLGMISTGLYTAIILDNITKPKLLRALGLLCIVTCLILYRIYTKAESYYNTTLQ